VESIHASSVTSGTSDWRKKDGFFRIETAREEIQRHVQGVFPAPIRVKQRGH
jgi:hypothetical protein